MGREEIKHILRVLKREGWKPKANTNEEQEVPRLTVLPAEVRARTHSNVSPAVRTARRRSVLVMWKGGPSMGAPLPPLQEVENEQQELWKAVGRETGWKAGRCRHVQIWELFSLETCD